MRWEGGGVNGNFDITKPKYTTKTVITLLSRYNILNCQIPNLQEEKLQREC